MPLNYGTFLGQCGGYAYLLVDPGVKNDIADYFDQFARFLLMN
jgi:hypothetical protein